MKSRRFLSFKLATVFATFAFLVIGFNNCAKQDFQSIADQHSAASIGSAGTIVYRGTLSATATSVPLDIVWVVDNSGSMSDTVAEVNRNFSTFLSLISSQTDVKVALISKKGTGGTSLTLPIINANQLQIDQSVGSTNALQLLLGDLGQNPLKSFLRSNSKKVFVVVTDDQSAISSGSFLNSLNTLLPGENPTVFGFVGLGAAASSCEAHQGTVYSSLASSSGGQVFNVCDQNWTTSFAALTDNLVNLVNSNTVALNSATISQILAVKVNGQQISSNDYQLSSLNVVINPDVLTGAQTFQIEVDYLP